MKEKSICCSLTLMLTGMESVYFAVCNFKTTDKSVPVNLGIFPQVPIGIKVSFRNLTV